MTSRHCPPRSTVAVWSNLNIGGIRLQDVNAKIGTDDDPENWTDLHQRVIRAAYEVIQCKGYTNWAIGMTVASIVEAVLRNEHRVLPVSTLIKGAYGVGQEVCDHSRQGWKHHVCDWEQVMDQWASTRQTADSPWTDR